MNNPQRTCIACKSVKDKKELIRIVRTKEGEIELDPTGRKNGRGAYICKDSKGWSAPSSHKYQSMYMTDL